MEYKNVFLQHFSNHNSLPEKYFSSCDFLELNYEINSNYCKTSIHTESKQSSSRNFKCNNFLLRNQKKKTGENKKRSFRELITWVWFLWVYINKNIRTCTLCYKYIIIVACCSFWILQASNINNWLFWVCKCPNTLSYCCLEFPVSLFFSFNSSHHNSISFSLSCWSSSAFSGQ